MCKTDPEYPVETSPAGGLWQHRGSFGGTGLAMMSECGGRMLVRAETWCLALRWRPRPVPSGSRVPHPFLMLDSGASSGRDRTGLKVYRWRDRRSGDSSTQTLPRQTWLARGDLSPRSTDAGALSSHDVCLIHTPGGDARSPRARRPDRWICVHRPVRLSALSLGPSAQ